MEEHYELFKQMDNRLGVILKDKKLYENENLLYSFVNDFKSFLYTTIHTTLEPNKKYGDNEKYIRYYVKYIISKLLPVCNAKIKQFHTALTNIGNQAVLLKKWANLEDDLYALASMRSIKHFAFYIERGTPKKVWAVTMPLFESYYYYVNQMILDGNIEKMRSSFFPGAGKSYSGNITCAFWFGVDEQISILRITYSDDLAKSFTKQIKNIIDSPQYRKVFPKFDLENKDLYKTNNAGELWFSFSNGTNFYATTRDGQTTGKRAKVLIVDDITKGAKEAYKVDVHKQIVNMYDSDWSSRGDDDDQKQIIMGTMWSPYDLLNVIQKRAEKDAELMRDGKFPYTLVDGKSKSQIKNIFISVPLLDYDTDESTCPARYSTEKARKKRDEYQDRSLFNAIYQQLPDAPNELIFDHKNLKHYREQTIPKEIIEGNCECRAMVDPARKGYDYFCMLIFKRYMIDEKEEKYSKWYLIDCVFKRKAFKDLIDRVCDKIIKHRVSKITIETNTSTDMPQLLEEHLENLGYVDIEIEDIYSVENKEDKIRNAETGMKSEIVYPDQYMYPEISEMGQGMIQFTTYDIEGSNKHDDFPDCCAMFVKYNCEEEIANSLTVLDSTFRI